MFWYTKSTHGNEKRGRKRKRTTWRSHGVPNTGRDVCIAATSVVWDAGIRKQNNLQRMRNGPEMTKQQSLPAAAGAGFPQASPEDVLFQDVPGPRLRPRGSAPVEKEADRLLLPASCSKG